MAEAPDVFDVAAEQLIGARVFTGVYRLGEVDDDWLIFPIENVEGGEVAVDAVVGEEKVDVVADARIDVIGLLGRGADGAELGGGVLLVADVLHEDGRAAVALGDGAGRVGADVEEVMKGFPFVVEPASELDRAAHFGFVGEGAHLAAAAHFFSEVKAFSLAIHLVIFEAAVFDGFVNFSGEKAAAEIGVGATAADGGFFATLEDLNDFGDEIALEEIFEGRGQEIVVKHGDSENWCAERTLHW